MSVLAHSGFGRYQNCPICKKRFKEREPRRRLGPFNVHVGCEAICPLCGEVVAEPPFTRKFDVSAWCGKPAHAACKEQ